MGILKILWDISGAFGGVVSFAIPIPVDKAKSLITAVNLTDNKFTDFLIIFEEFRSYTEDSDSIRPKSTGRSLK